MNTHKNARLTYLRRLERVQDITERGLAASEAAAPITDNGKCFHSPLFGATCLELGIAQKFTRAYRPQTKGKAERFIQWALREWAYGRTYANSEQRRAAVPIWTTSTTGTASTTASASRRLSRVSRAHERTS